MPKRSAAVTLPPEREKDFLQTVKHVARLYGWKPYHTFVSAFSDAGFPDLVLVKRGQPVIYAELKRQNGRLTAAQAEWLDLLQHAEGAEVYVWRPSDFDAIVRRLMS